jgi:hypothetical protein
MHVRPQTKLAGLSELVWILLLVSVRHAFGVRRILLHGCGNGGFFRNLVVGTICWRLHPHVDCSFVGLARLLVGSGRPFRWHHCCACATEAVSAVNSQTFGLRVAGTIFGLMCWAQVLRLATRAELIVAGHQVPLWVSAVAVIIAGGLSVWLWKLSHTGARGEDEP